MFQEGQRPTLQEVLEQRENRVYYIEKLAKRYPNATIVSLKCNIPGPIKQNEYLQLLFEKVFQKFCSLLEINKTEIVFLRKLEENTGSECYIVITDSPPIIKGLSIQLENEPLGRLIDVDVHYLINGVVESISRKDLGLPTRKCFVCENDAKTCASRRIHSIEVLHTKIIELVNDEGKEFL